MQGRGFEIAKGYEDKDIHIPVRKTANSAGYDVEAASDMVIPPYKPGMKPSLIPTGLKAYCQPDEFFMLVNRSSGPKKGFLMSNSIGIIDADYYGNSDNDGHIFVCLQNEGDKVIEIKKGDRFVQGIFIPYLVTDDDATTDLRKGGIGSTNNKGDDL